MALQILARYQYDPLDRLANCSFSGRPVDLRFYRNDRMVSQVIGSTRLSLLHVEGQLLAVLLTGHAQHPHGLTGTDRQGSLINGLGVSRPFNRAYTPYGAPSSLIDTSGLPAFTGETPDPVTGHYLLGNGARTFNPVLMRFTSPDNLSPFDKGGINAYAYCSNDPVNNIDPSAHVISRLAGHIKNATSALKRTKVRLPKQDVGFLQTTIESVTHGSKSIDSVQSRYGLDMALGKLQSDAPFVQKLQAVNQRLASHGNPDLSIKHAKYYENLALQAHHGEFSSTTAHLKSAQAWMEKFRGPDRPGSAMSGAIFNRFAAFMSGVEDQALYKTGKVLSSIRKA